MHGQQNVKTDKSSSALTQHNCLSVSYGNAPGILSRSHLKTLGAGWVTSSNLNTHNPQIKLHHENPQISLHHAQCSTRSDQAPGFCAPFFYLGG